MNNPQPYVPQSLGARIAHARRLLAVREGKDVTVPELAERVGVTGASVYNWEGGEATPGETNLGKLAKVLGVTPEYLRYGVTPKGQPTLTGLDRRTHADPDAEPDRGKAGGE